MNTYVILILSLSSHPILTPTPLKQFMFCSGLTNNTNYVFYWIGLRFDKVFHHVGDWDEVGFGLRRVYIKNRITNEMFSLYRVELWRRCLTFQIKNVYVSLIFFSRKCHTAVQKKIPSRPNMSFGRYK